MKNLFKYKKVNKKQKYNKTIKIQKLVIKIMIMKQTNILIYRKMRKSNKMIIYYNKNKKYLIQMINNKIIRVVHLLIKIHHLLLLNKRIESIRKWSHQKRHLKEKNTYNNNYYLNNHQNNLKIKNN